jgi:hypothetical protein
MANRLIRASLRRGAWCGPSAQLELVRPEPEAGDERLRHPEQQTAGQRDGRTDESTKDGGGEPVDDERHIGVERDLLDRGDEHAGQATQRATDAEGEQAHLGDVDADHPRRVPVRRARRQGLAQVGTGEEQRHEREHRHRDADDQEVVGLHPGAGELRRAGQAGE